jgi:RND family efflux transporter MFP subunit
MDPRAAARVPISALALVGAILVGCNKKGGSEGPKTRPPPLVAVAPVAARDVRVDVSAPVDLRPIAQADVGSKTLGILDAVLVDRGDSVRQGQLLALVRPSDLPDQLEAARGSLAQTQASVALARTNHERATKLAPSGIVSQQELQQATAALASAEAAQTAAQSQVAAFATRLGELRIEAPMDGVVASRRLDPGALVGPTTGGPILSLVRIDPLRVFVGVPERQASLVSVGLPAHVEVDALPGRSFEGKVVRLAPTLDAATRTLDAEVQLSNKGGELRAGMFGRGAIVVGTHAHVPVVPPSALRFSSGKPIAFVHGDGKVQRRVLTLGVDHGDWLEVVAGVREGEEIVVAGVDDLSDGAAVRVSRDRDPYTGARAQTGPKASDAGASDSPKP